MCPLSSRPIKAETSLHCLRNSGHSARQNSWGQGPGKHSQDGHSSSPVLRDPCAVSSGTPGLLTLDKLLKVGQMQEHWPMLLWSPKVPQGTLYATSWTLGLDELLKAGQTQEHWLCPSTVVWAPEVPPVRQGSYAQPVVFVIAQPKPSLNQDLLFYLDLGWVPSFFFFFTWICDFSIDSQVL